MQTEHHPHSSTRQHFHPPSLADDPPLGRPGRRPPPTAPPPSSPPIAATTTLTLRRPLRSRAPCRRPTARMAAHSRASPAWPGRVATQQQHVPGAQQLRS
ncbi:putative GPI-anchored protein 58 [Iris pallida]|uniref:GPI-anchored protein 58 n=1 Tax=Iris pallida TaxID=29817 RepID=A0AAX6GS86_IRIPA|nr:putative GPI-anchored protein 58 [Iris pallida]